MVPDSTDEEVASLARSATFAAERMPLGAALTLAALFVVSGLLVAVLSQRLASGSIVRNRLMGLRLPSTTLLLRPSEGLAIVIASAASIWLVALPAIGAFAGDLAAKDAG